MKSVFCNICVYECGTCRYVWLNALNVLHAPRPCFIAPNMCALIFIYLAFQIFKTLIELAPGHVMSLTITDSLSEVETASLNFRS